MTVEFRCKSPKQNKLTLSNLPNGVNMVSFYKGIYTTTDKNVVSTLMTQDAFRRGTIMLQTPEEDVERWLSNDEDPSYITKEWVAQLSNSAVLAIGQVAKVNSKTPTLIRMELVGLPLTSKIEDIAKAYREEESTEAHEADMVREAFDAKETMDEIDILVSQGVIHREGPWYKDTQTGESIGRNKESVKNWLASKE
jgi:hypothetical protein